MIAISVFGSALIALGYMFLSLNLIKEKMFFYMLLIGDIAVAVHSMHTKDLPVLFLSIAFMVFSLLAILDIEIKIPFFSMKTFLISLLITIMISYYMYFHNHPLLNTMGWFSFVADLGIYLLYTQKRVSLFNYFLTNMFANITFASYLFFVHNYPYMALQLFMFCFSSYGVFRLVFKEQYFKKDALDVV